jgi:membrane dipeptidase
VPFRCPSSPDTGPGLTDLGKELIGACNRLGILIDLSHLNERGFWDVAAISNAPLVATHSNAHALSPHSRNLIDSQLAAIRETGGIVGVNFATSFLRRDGRHDVDTPIELVIEHLEHILEHVGENGVGFGSDFDGAKIPAAIGNAAGLQNLVEVMRTRGYGEPLIEKLCYRNWLRVLGQTWGRVHIR